MDNRLPPKKTWHSVSPLFTGDRECLAAFLALEAAEVVEGRKPANLINIPDRRRPCGRNFFTLWQIHGRDVLAGSSLKGFVLAERRGSILLLVYREELMAALLSRNNVRVLLERSGYTCAGGTEETLATLKQRIAGAAFPHEIGIFLGYPLKDVAGFVGWAKIPFTCQGPWKIYGDPSTSLALAAEFRKCRERIAARLCECEGAGRKILKEAA